MAKAFSVASWNVGHFKGDPVRTGQVFDFLKAQNPDVLGIYEVEGAQAVAALTTRFPGYACCRPPGQ